MGNNFSRYSIKTVRAMPLQDAIAELRKPLLKSKTFFSGLEFDSRTAVFEFRGTPDGGTKYTVRLEYPPGSVSRIYAADEKSGLDGFQNMNICLLPGQASVNKNDHTLLLGLPRGENLKIEFEQKERTGEVWTGQNHGTFRVGTETREGASYNRAVIDALARPVIIYLTTGRATQVFEIR